MPSKSKIGEGSPNGTRKTKKTTSETDGFQSGVNLKAYGESENDNCDEVI